jgi:hypothetical protein
VGGSGSWTGSTRDLEEHALAVLVEAAIDGEVCEIERRIAHSEEHFERLRRTAAGERFRAVLHRPTGGR